MGSAASNLVGAGISGSDNLTTSVSKPIVENSQRICTSRGLMDQVSLLSNFADWKRFASEMVDLCAQAVMRWFGDLDQSTVRAETGSATGIGKKKTTTTRCQDSLPKDSWRRSGYYLHSRSYQWRFFTPVSYLPLPNAELFKEYSVCGHGGLTNAEVSMSSTKGEPVVFSPSTGETRALRPLPHSRNPMVVHISVDSDKNYYKVIVAGNSSASDEHLSRKVKVLDPSISKWRELCDLPGPAFGPINRTLNEHQAGVCLNGNLYFISFLEGGSGVVALDVENGTWLQDLATRIPWSSYSDTLELVENGGKLFLVSEPESDQSVVSCIDELEFQNPKTGTLTCRWRSFVKVRKSGERGLRVYPEYTCVGFGERIFSPLSWKKLYFLLASCIAIIMPSGAFAGDPSTDSLSGTWNPNTWESAEFAKAAAGTLFAGLMMIGAAGVGWRIFRRRQAPGNRFDIMRGLEVSDRPGRREQLHEILPATPA